ncbi:hypothetical protein Tco_1159743 [Tanacetum coccineum]
MIFGNIKREGKGFSRRRKQQSRKSKKKNTEVPQPSGSTDNVPDENLPITSNDPLLSGEDRLKLTKLIDLCTNLQKKVLNLEKAKTAQDSEIASLKKKVKKLERRNKLRTPGLKRLRKVGSARMAESSDEACLGDQEDASKQERKIADIDADVKVTLIDDTQGRNDDNLMFETGVLDEQEVEVEKEILPKEILGDITQRDIGRYYLKRYWEILPKEILGDTTQRDIGRYYPKRYWESLPKDILGVTTLRDTSMYLGNNISG